MYNVVTNGMNRIDSHGLFFQYTFTLVEILSIVRTRIHKIIKSVPAQWDDRLGDRDFGAFEQRWRPQILT